MIILKPIFSNLSHTRTHNTHTHILYTYIYIYSVCVCVCVLILVTLTLQMKTTVLPKTWIHQTNVLSRLRSSHVFSPEFIRLEDEGSESPQNLTKPANILFPNFATSTQNSSDLYKFQCKSVTHFTRNRIRHFIVYNTC